MNLRQNQRGFAHHFLLIAIVLITAVAGVGLYVKDHHKKNLSHEQQSSTISETIPSTIFGLDKIKELATAQAGGKTISSVALVKEDSNYIYKIRLDNGTVLVFNATTGQQLNRGAQAKADDQNDTETTEDLPSNFAAQVTFDQARAAATAAHDGTIDSIELEGENHSVVYKIEFTDGTKVMINAVTGQVLNTKTEKSQSQSQSQKSGIDSIINHDDSNNDSNGNQDSGSSSGSDSNNNHDNNNDGQNSGDHSDSGESGGSGDSGGSGGGDNSTNN